MPTYLDESGDFGPRPSATDEFRLTAVYFESRQHAVDCEAAIAAVRSVNGWPATHLFHWSKTPPARRLAFFQAIAAQEFVFVSCTVDKPLARSTGVPLTAESIAVRAAAGVAEGLREWYEVAEACLETPLNERVWLAHHDNDKYVDAIRTAFKSLRSLRKPGASLVKNMTTRRPESDDLIQLADMVCGAIGEAENGGSDCYSLVARNAVAAVRWPRNETRAAGAARV